MTPSARLAALIELTDLLHAEWLKPQPRPAEQVLKAYTAQRRYIGGGDRRHLQESLFTLLRNYGAARKSCEAAGLPVTGRSIALMSLGKEAAALCTGENYAPARLTELERAAQPSTLNHQPHLPEWLEAQLHRQYGAETETLMAALLQPAPLDLRVNLLKTTPAKALAALKAEGIEAQPIEGLANGLTVSGRSVPLTNTQAFQDGWVEVQDRGSQAVIETLLGCLHSAQGAARSEGGIGGSIPPLRILDYCAGAGGKSLALASGLGGEGEIIAYDNNPERLAELAPRAKRAGANNVKTWPKSVDLLPQADIVLLDVPCSGTGTLRRHPDLAWRVPENKIQEYNVLQRNILRKGAEKLKSRGWLVYVTCSLLESENIQNVNDFLTHHSEFTVANLTNLWNKGPATEVQTLQFLPHTHGSDGFFMAVLQRLS